ncbi:thiamine diphosphokinase [Ornithinibacillus halophilus]|uniref:Thiamine diphosphokinase n=1 Tax=Ornithinibacillus halophilus TaxID=930117 RepID=A0A1M5C6U1_9BACI|nr:thiamine diphosphokinase [Ornithinibacillus halophilus]SHF50473.1 thiamine diphosphokinase [Ornithinibacillus halophilus]
MLTIGIVGNGLEDMLPDLTQYHGDVDIWIGADKGALILIQNKLSLDYAVGDFDSVMDDELSLIKEQARNVEQFPIEKDETDIEIALKLAFSLQPQQIFLFGVTGGRLDHSLVNIQLLLSIVEKGIKGIIIDNLNIAEMTLPGTHSIKNEIDYPNISFIPMTPTVIGLSLENFYYPLTDETIHMGSSLCISNKLLLNNGTFFYDEGILLVIKSRD